MMSFLNSHAASRILVSFLSRKSSGFSPWGTTYSFSWKSPEGKVKMSGGFSGGGGWDGRGKEGDGSGSWLRSMVELRVIRIHESLGANKHEK
jgi:hypothetical protein